MSCSFVHSTIHLQKMPLGKLSVFCIRYFSKTKCKPAKKIAGQCFSTQVKAACTHSANLERETEITKIVTYPLFPLAFSNVLADKPHPQFDLKILNKKVQLIRWCLRYVAHILCRELHERVVYQWRLLQFSSHFW